MAKSKRTNIMRVYVQAINDFDRCLANLRSLEELYEPAHPIQHTAIVSVIKSTLLVQETLVKIKTELA